VAWHKNAGIDSRAIFSSFKVLQTQRSHHVQDSIWSEMHGFVRHREDLPLALRGVSFEAAAGQKVGIVGRGRGPLGFFFGG
jgi:ABC-type polysaccharide/polyol phosphate transport system ATPase subunit